MHKVYHGSTHIIEQPLCHIGRDNLDFGKGFYVTNIKKQAISWATRVVNLGLPQWLNIYEIDEEYIKLHAKCRIFNAYDYEWLNFIVESRNKYVKRITTLDENWQGLRSFGETIGHFARTSFRYFPDEQN